jgi:hypothetical protein
MCPPSGWAHTRVRPYRPEAFLTSMSATWHEAPLWVLVRLVSYFATQLIYLKYKLKIDNRPKCPMGPDTLGKKAGRAGGFVAILRSDS